jgi:hypothetical protein
MTHTKKHVPYKKVKNTCCIEKGKDSLEKDKNYSFQFPKHCPEATVLKNIQSKSNSFKNIQSLPHGRNCTLRDLKQHGKGQHVQ